MKNIKVPPTPNNFLATALRGGDECAINFRLVFFLNFALTSAVLRKPLNVRLELCYVERLVIEHCTLFTAKNANGPIKLP